MLDSRIYRRATPKFRNNPMVTKSENHIENPVESERDRAFMDELAGMERERILAGLRTDESEDSAGLSSGVVDHVAELAARVTLLECASELGLLASGERRSVKNAALYARGRVDVLKMDADSVFHDTVESDGNVRFRWTRVARLELELPVQRLRTRYLRIRFASIIKSEYARTARVSIDEKSVRLWCGRTEADYFFECAMPPSEDLVASRVVLEIDAAHSPSDLGLSDDNRSLGIAIIAVEYSSRPEAGLPARLIASIRPAAS